MVYHIIIVAGKVKNSYMVLWLTCSFLYFVEGSPPLLHYMRLKYLNDEKSWIDTTSDINEQLKIGNKI